LKLERYDAIRKALVMATRVDEVKTIRDKAIALTVYAKQAKDRELIEKATDIRLRAEVRAGELLIVMAKSGERGKGRKKKESDQSTLSSLGISKDESYRWRKLATMTVGKRDQLISRRIRIVVAAVDGDQEVIKEARAERQKVKKVRRQKREKELAAKIEALPVKKYGVGLADPEWRFTTWSSETGMDRAADNHYPTSVLDDIKARDVPSICAADCAMFLWATPPMLDQAIEVLKAWGFTYITNAVWIKPNAGTGYWFRFRHEHLLLGVRGEVPCPAQGDQWDSVIEQPRGKHSEKPDAVYELIEAYFPNVPKIELNARKARKGWDSWGAEAPVAEAAE
jgi:N6-adenosine-specific RNA methylase IME4